MVTTLKGTIRGGVTFSATPATISIPTGSVTITDSTYTFTVPAGIKVVALRSKVYHIGTKDPFYIGVTPGSSHKLKLFVKRVGGGQMLVGGIACGTHHDNEWGVYDVAPAAEGLYRLINYTISWSPEINAHAPNRSDY